MTKKWSMIDQMTWIQCSIYAKKHGLGDPTLWPSELHQGVEGPQGLPQGGTLEQIFVFWGGNEI